MHIVHYVKSHHPLNQCRVSGAYITIAVQAINYSDSAAIFFERGGDEYLQILILISFYRNFYLNTQILTRFPTGWAEGDFRLCLSRILRAKQRVDLSAKLENCQATNFCQS